MRFLSIILVMPLLNGCLAYSTRERCIYERSPAVSGTLLDERTQTPVSGADVYFTADPHLCSKSDKDGRFEISATQYHYVTVGHSLGGRSEFRNPPLDTEIMITHTNWATRQIHWDQSPQTILLKKLPEPSDVRPWLTFDGNGVVLQDHGAIRYLVPGRIMTIPGSAPITFLVRTNNDGSVLLISVPIAQKLFDPHLTVLRGPNKPSFLATEQYGNWSFWPSTKFKKDPSYLYKLEFIR